jgi:hypothetical protein
MLIGEWVTASLGLIAVFGLVAIPIFSIGFYVISRAVRRDRVGRRRVE